MLFFPGIFGYINYLTPKSRKEILELLVNGLKRLEYRGYDSAGKFSKFRNSLKYCGMNCKKKYNLAIMLNWFIR